MCILIISQHVCVMMCLCSVPLIKHIICSYKVVQSCIVIGATMKHTQNSHKTLHMLIMLQYCVCVVLCVCVGSAKTRRGTATIAIPNGKCLSVLLLCKIVPPKALSSVILSTEIDVKKKSKNWSVLVVCVRCWFVCSNDKLPVAGIFTGFLLLD